MGIKMIFYLTNVTNTVNLSQPSVRIGGGLHAPSIRTALSKPVKPEGNQKKVSVTLSAFSSYDPPKTPSPRLSSLKKFGGHHPFKGGPQKSSLRGNGSPD